jgi:ParB family chromosome partitioning protein
MEGTSKRRALGRGLGALIPAEPKRATAPEEPDRPPLAVPIDSIRPNPLQPRQQFSEDALAELAASITEKGILQPLLVRPRDGSYELIAGERRFRAAQRAGLKEVPVTVRLVEDADLLEIALIENIQRENLNAIEEGRAYRRLLDEFGLTQEQVAQRVGKDRSTIANTLRLLQLPLQIQAEIESGKLSAGHARALLSIESDEEKLRVAGEILGRRLSVRDTERLTQKRPVASRDVHLLAAEENLRQALGTQVRLRHRHNGSGRIEIEYYSLDELNGLLTRLGAF